MLLVSDARHYSITKAADFLGIGRKNIVLIDTDATFRMDVRSLESETRRAVAKGLLPIAVTAIAEQH